MSCLVIWGLYHNLQFKGSVTSQIEKEILLLLPKLLKSCVFLISNGYESPQIQNAHFPCRIQYVAKPSGWEGCSNMPSPLRRQPSWVQSNQWVHAVAARWVYTVMRARRVMKERSHWDLPVAASRLLQAGCPHCGHLSQGCCGASESPQGPFPREPATSITPSCTGWRVVMATQWAQQMLNRRQASHSFPSESIRGVLWEMCCCRHQINRQKQF